MDTVIVIYEYLQCVYIMPVTPSKWVVVNVSRMDPNPNPNTSAVYAAVQCLPVHSTVLLFITHLKAVENDNKLCKNIELKYVKNKIVNHTIVLHSICWKCRDLRHNKKKKILLNIVLEILKHNPLFLFIFALCISLQNLRKGKEKNKREIIGNNRP